MNNPFTIPNVETALADDLHNHIAVCRDLLAVLQGEDEALRDDASFPWRDFFHARKSLAPRLARSVDALRARRPACRAPGVALVLAEECRALLRQSQDLMMKIIVLDRENEQALLRRGLVPTGQLSSVPPQRPHFVADLYRRRDA
jgi:hypothetical protein